MIRLLFYAVLIILSAFTACDDIYNDAFSDATPEIKYYGYVTTTNSLYSYSILEDGSFQQIGAPVTGLTSPQRIAVHPSGDYIYVAANGSILCYKTGDDGALTPLASLVNGILNYDMVIHPSGKYLYAIATSGAVNPNIYIYRINPDGTLTFINTIMKASATSCDAIAINPSGSRIFLSCKDGAASYIQAFIIGVDGNLTVGTSPSANATIGLAAHFISLTVHPSKDYLYTILYGNSVRELNINSNGTLTTNSSTSVLSATDVKVSISAKNIYISIFAAGVPSESYSILNTGTLFKISDNNTPPLAAMNSIEVHPNGKYVYFTDSSVTYKSLICYTAEAIGSLTFKSLTADCSTNPFDVKICTKTVYGANN